MITALLRHITDYANLQIRSIYGETDMIVGFNHNMTYRGVCFHVQTEDSGVKAPHLITLLYHGGTIISSQKTSYADILNVDNLDAVIEDLAKEQHKGMLRRLKKGEFDQRILDFGIQITPVGQPVETVETETAPAPVLVSSAPEYEAEPAVAEPEVAFPEPEDFSAADSVAPTFEETTEPQSAITDLDDLIFSYLSGDDGKE